MMPPRYGDAARNLEKAFAGRKVLRARERQKAKADRKKAADRMMILRGTAPDARQWAEIRRSGKG